MSSILARNPICSETAMIAPLSPSDSEGTKLSEDDHSVFEAGESSSNLHRDRLGTRVVHVGSLPDRTTGAVIRPISLSTTFAQEAVGVHGGFEYSRSLNPNRLDLETVVASLEGVDELERTEPGGLLLPRALAVASGSAATATVLTALVGAGGHVVAMSDVYGGTYRYLKQVAPSLGIACDMVDLSCEDDSEEASALAAGRLLGALRPGQTRLVWVESPTNPTLRLVNIGRLSQLAHAHGLLLAVDNTFLSPFYQQPARLGADVVVHSATKYINGHSDVVLGMIVSPDPQLVRKMRFLQNAQGAVPSAFDCWLAQRGLKTLELRMLRHGANALALAHWLQSVALEQRGWITEVIYPGLQGAQSLAWRQIPAETRELLGRAGHGPHTRSHSGQFPYGGMLSFRIRQDTGGSATAERFLSGCRLFALAESLGGVESLAGLPARMTHATYSPEDRAATGIDGGLIRLSVGIEDIRDLIKDVEQALAQTFKIGEGAVGSMKKLHGEILIELDQEGETH